MLSYRRPWCDYVTPDSGEFEWLEAFYHRNNKKWLLDTKNKPQAQFRPAVRYCDDPMLRFFFRDQISRYYFNPEMSTVSERDKMIFE